MPRPGSRLRVAGPHAQISLTANDRSGYERQLTWVERSVAIHEADDVRARRLQSCEACCAKPAARLTYDPRAMP